MLPAEGDPFAAGLGGTEQAIIHLTGALAARGHGVRVAGGSVAARVLGGVAWLAAGAAAGAADVTVAVNDARLLGDGGGRTVVWFHNEVTLWREMRKRRLPALVRGRPWAVFIGREQARLASRLLPFRGRAVVPYGLPPAVLGAAVGDGVRGSEAVFTSQAYRGLREVIGAWRTGVAPRCPGARLTAYVGAADVAAYAGLAAGVAGVSVLPRVGNDAMLDVLRGARVLVAPGHVSETFCLAAAEAVAMGVPVVTLGVGSLKERVVDGETGFVARGWAELADRVVQVLTDDAVWARLHANGVATRVGAGWDGVAARWEALVDAAG